MATDKKDLLKVKDYSVSGEFFDIVYDQSLGIYKTDPQPDLESLPRYYESEDYISHTDSTDSFIDKLYQFAKKFSIRRKVKLVNKFQPNKGSLLDIGCGTGDFLSAAYTDGWQIYGIEPDSEARALAAKKTGKDIWPTEELWDIEVNQYDLVSLWHVLEHLPDLDSYISTFKRILSPEGTLVIAVPNYKSYDAKHYEKHWAAYDVPRHLWHFSKEGLVAIFKKHGFVLEEIKPMKLDSFYVSLLSEKYKNGRTNYFMAFCIGLVSNIKALFSGEYSSLIYILKKA